MIDRGGPNFLWIAAWIATLAGLSAGLCAAMNLAPWLMFLGWSTYVTGNGSVKAGWSAVSCALLGVPLGIGGALFLGAIAPALGPFALMLVVFLLAGFAVLSTVTPPLNSPVGWFLGLLGYFGSQMKPEVASLYPVMAPILIGAISGWVAGLVAAKIAAAGSASQPA
jgi:hypothetical protein